MEPIKKSKINTFFTNWLRNLEANNKKEVENSFCEIMNFSSSAHGKSSTAKDTAELLLSALRSKVPNILRSSNHFISSEMTGRNNITLSAYIYGLLNNEMVFGATMISQITTDQNGSLKFNTIKLAFNWTEGNRSAFQAWRFPIQERLWQPGDPTNVIVSELDAPWWKENSNKMSTNLWNELQETFSRYAWAIDQYDIKLLTKCFTQDATGNFPPMGFLSGINEIITNMKAFRQPWSWMQHFGELLEVESTDSNTALIRVGRIIPQAMNFQEATKTFGAYYKLELKKTEVVWKINYFDYRPGWFRYPAE
jgi:hypothetical protein